MRIVITSIVLMLCLLGAKAQRHSIADYGDITDSTRIYTAMIQRAIDDCYAEGGGRVELPAGIYPSGTLFLRSNVELHLCRGALLVASSSYDDFPIIPPTDYRSQKDAAGWTSLIYAEKAENIAITGEGTIDGRGKGRRGRIKGVGGDCNGRPRNLLFISCSGIRIEGITLKNSALWCQHYLNCSDVRVENIRVWNHCNGNNDGIDIDGCRRFSLKNSIIDADDDGIVLKSTGTAPCDDVEVERCTVSSFANAIKLGTESTGGFRNIRIHDCQVRPSLHTGERIIKSTPSGVTAISIEEVDGGVVDSITISRIDIEGTECPIYIRLANRGRRHTADAPTPPVGQMRNIRIDSIRAHGVGNFGCSITGIAGHKIEGIELSNISITNRGGLKAGNYRSHGDSDASRHDTSSTLFLDRYWATAADVIEDDRGYPQPTVWGNLPSYGFFVRHVDGIAMRNITLNSIGTEPREALIFVDTDNISINK